MVPTATSGVSRRPPTTTRTTAMAQSSGTTESTIKLESEGRERETGDDVVANIPADALSPAEMRHRGDNRADENTLYFFSSFIFNFFSLFSRSRGPPLARALCTTTSFRWGAAFSLLVVCGPRHRDRHPGSSNRALRRRWPPLLVRVRAGPSYGQQHVERRRCRTAANRARHQNEKPNRKTNGRELAPLIPVCPLACVPTHRTAPHAQQHARTHAPVSPVP